MTIKCSCGCGQDLQAEDKVVNEFGELETMRSDCRMIGRGEDFDQHTYEGKVWEQILADEGLEPITEREVIG
jgi:hypothetical protein